MSLNRYNRKLHSWAAILTAAPLLVIVLSGILLMVKKDFAWIQPPTQKGAAQLPSVPFSTILEACKQVPEAQIQTWADVDRLDLRPAHGVMKIRSQNGWEVQVDASTGAVLQSAFRRSDFIESIHDGSFFHDGVKTWVFLPTGLLLLLLWLTGLYLWLAPRLTRMLRQRSAHTPTR